MASLNIAIIVGSTRPGRSGATVAAWVHEQAATRTDANYEVVDLDEVDLPLLDEAVPSLVGRYEHQHTKDWAARPAMTEGSTMSTLTRDQARTIVDAALAAGTTEGIRISVAVTDAGGHLLSFDRNENANLATIDIAIQKARTSTFFKAPTAYLTQAMQPGGPLYTAESTSGGLSAIPGGVPITDSDGTMIGAIGISGGSSEQDNSIATGAVAA